MLCIIICMSYIFLNIENVFAFTFFSSSNDMPAFDQLFDALLKQWNSNSESFPYNITFWNHIFICLNRLSDLCGNVSLIWWWQWYIIIKMTVTYNSLKMYIYTTGGLVMLLVIFILFKSTMIRSISMIFTVFW